MERQLITQYKKDLLGLLDSLSSKNIDTAIAIAELPDMIRGFGHVKLAAVEKANLKRAELLKQFQTPKTSVGQAA